jgi:hypothetical protein
METLCLSPEILDEAFQSQEWLDESITIDDTTQFHKQRLGLRLIACQCMISAQTHYRSLRYLTRYFRASTGWMKVSKYLRQFKSTINGRDWTLIFYFFFAFFLLGEASPQVGLSPKACRNPSRARSNQDLLSNVYVQ